MKAKSLIIIGIVLASAVIGSVYAVSVQTRCEDLLDDTHYPRPLTFCNCLDYLQRVDNPPPKSTAVLEPEIKPVPEEHIDKNQDESNTPKIFRDGSTKFVNPDHEPLKYYKTTQVIDDTYLDKNVQQWQDAWDWELKANYEIYKDEFYEELGRLLVKNEITRVINQVGIINMYDDFDVHQGFSLTSLPPHVGFTAVINATDGNSYLIDASAHSNRVNYYSITQLSFFDTTKELQLADIAIRKQYMFFLKTETSPEQNRLI